MRKMLCLFFALVMIFNLCIPAMATTVSTDKTPTEATDSPPAVSPRAANRPSQPGSFPYNSRITNLDPGHLTYSKYYFKTGASTILAEGMLIANEENANDVFEVIFYLYELGKPDPIDSISTGKFNKIGKLSGNFINLDPNDYYYVSIYNATPSKFGENRQVSGDVLVFD